MRIDGHIHVMGNGTGGSGCWYHPRGITRLGEPFLRRSFGLPRDALTGDLEGIYVARLLELIRDSSLDAAVILAQELPHRENGTVIEDSGSFYVPNDYVLGLADRHPELIPAVSIHPARPDALDELDRCLKRGAAILKCLPNCQNIDWNNRRYTRFLERMAQAGLPLLAHTGGEHTLPVIDARLSDPRVLTRALEIGVTCIAAHCGTGTAWIDPDYFDVWADMTVRFPHLYGDNSAFCAPNFRFLRRMLTRFREPELAARIIHGSDAPVPVHGIVPMVSGMISRETFAQSRREINPIERDVLLKQGMGFPEESFTRLAGILRLPVVL